MTSVNGQSARLSPEVLDQTPPENRDAERWVLGSVFMNPSVLADVTAIVGPDDFRHEAHRLIFSHAIALANHGAVDHGLLIEHLKESGDLETVGGIVYVSEVVHAVPVSGHAVYYARIVRDKAIRRRARQIGEDVIQAAQNGHASTANLIRRTRDELDRLYEGFGDSEYPSLKGTEMDAAEYNTEYLIDGVLAAGQHCVIAAPIKALKSTIAIDAAISLSIGGHFLGYFPVGRAARVAVMNGESGPSAIQESARRIARAAGTDLSVLDNILFSTKLPKFGDPKHLDAMRRFILEHELEVVVIDPAYLCIPGSDAGNVMAMGDLLRSLGDVFTDLGTTMVLVHHVKKGVADPFQPGELNDMAWAGFQEWAAQWILLSRREKYEPGTGQHHLWMTVGGRLGHTGLYALDIDEGHFPDRVWDVQVLRADEARREARERLKSAREGRDGAAAPRATGERPEACVQRAGEAPGRRDQEHRQGCGRAIEPALRSGLGVPTRRWRRGVVRDHQEQQESPL